MDEELRAALQLVPAIADGTVEVVRWARVPGLRTKIAVRSADPDVDPVGAVVGPGGEWIRRVVTQLRGDAIDIIPFHAAPERLVTATVAPARIEKILIVGDALQLVVPDDELEKILGPDGQWLQLSAQIVGVRLDVFSRSRIDALEAEGRAKLGALGFLDEAQLSKLVRVGIYDLADLRDDDEAWLAEILASPEAARRLTAAALSAR